MHLYGIIEFSNLEEIVINHQSVWDSFRADADGTPNQEGSSKFWRFRGPMRNGKPCGSIRTPEQMQNSIQNMLAVNFQRIAAGEEFVRGKNQKIPKRYQPLYKVVSSGYTLNIFKVKEKSAAIDGEKEKLTIPVVNAAKTIGEPDVSIAKTTAGKIRETIAVALGKVK